MNTGPDARLAPPTHRHELFLQEDLPLVLTELFRTADELAADEVALSAKARRAIQLLGGLDDRVFAQLAVAYSNDRRREGGAVVDAIEQYIQKRLARLHEGPAVPAPKRPLAAWKWDAVLGAAGGSSWLISAVVFFSLFTYEPGLLPVLLAIVILDAALTLNFFRVANDWLEAHYARQAPAAGHA